MQVPTPNTQRFYVVYPCQCAFSLQNSPDNRVTSFQQMINLDLSFWWGTLWSHQTNESFRFSNHAKVLVFTLRKSLETGTFFIVAPAWHQIICRNLLQKTSEIPFVQNIVVLFLNVDYFVKIRFINPIVHIWVFSFYLNFHWKEQEEPIDLPKAMC